VTRAQVERGTLLLLIAINGVMFIIELAAGWVADSMGLIADSLDMLADAGVYGIALLAVGSSPVRKVQAAAASGCLQLALAGVVLLEVARKWLHGSEPVSGLMVGVSAVALVANGDVSEVEDFEFGRKYTVSGELRGPRGAARVLTVWIQEAGQEGVRLVTVRPE